MNRHEWLAYWDANCEKFYPIFHQYGILSVWKRLLLIRNQDGNYDRMYGLLTHVWDCLPADRVVWKEDKEGWKELWELVNNID